MFMMLCR